MLHSSKNRNSKKKSSLSSTKRIRQTGDNFHLSQLGNPNTSGYLGDVKTAIPEKLRYKKQEIEKKDILTKMDTVKSSDNMGAEKNAPFKIGEIKLDTGILEVGYDDEKQDIVFSFAYYNAADRDKMVYESMPTKTLGNNAEWFRSQSQQFSGKSVDFRTHFENYYRVNDDFIKLSNEKSHNSTIDNVIPFIQHKDEQNKIDELRTMKSSDTKDRANIHNAITGVETLKTQKDQRKIDFIQKFTKAVKDATEIKHKFINKDDYILYLKKKWLMMYEESNIGNPDDNTNNDQSPEINEGLEDQNLEQEQVQQQQEQESEAANTQETDASDSNTNKNNFTW